MPGPTLPRSGALVTEAGPQVLPVLPRQQVQRGVGVGHWMGRIHYYRDQPREAIGYFQQVLAVGQELGDEELLAIPLAVMGRALVVQGHFGKAIPFLARAVTLLEKSDEWLDWSFSKAYHGVAVAAGGRPSEGLAETANALAGAEDTKNPTAIAGCQMVMAIPALPGQGPTGVL